MFEIIYEDSVLYGVTAFFVSAGIIWFLIIRTNFLNISPRLKRLISYLLIGILIIVVFIIFDNHSSTYIATVNTS